MKLDYWDYNEIIIGHLVRELRMKRKLLHMVDLENGNGS